MMRSRAKVVGLGLALFAGQAVANDPWNAAGPTANDPIWLPPRKVVPAPLAVPPATLPLPAPVEPVPKVPPRADFRASPLAPLPAIPTLPVDGATAPSPPPSAVAVPQPTGLTIPPLPDAWQPVPPAGTAVRHELQEPAPPPRSTEPPRSLPLPKPTPVEPPPRTEVPRAETPRQAEPPPRTITPVQAELPCAPPELMTPHGVGVPGVRGTFGSAPISLSRDYMTCRDVIDNVGLGRHPLFAPATGGPATDRLFFSAEYLLWWVNAARIPELATTSVDGGDGYLGLPGTRLLLGPGTFGDSIRHGLRLRGGAWLNEEGTRGIDGSFFYLGRRTNSVTFNPETTGTITRPIFAPNTNTEFGEIVSQPTFSRGTFNVEARSELWGADVNVRNAICRKCDYRHEWFVGYRFLSLKESLVMAETITALETAPNPPGTEVFVQDSFRTKNRFHGGQIGGVWERKWDRVSLEVRGSVALGATNQQVDIEGFQIRQQPGLEREVFNGGGLLAAGPNLGTFSQNKFAVVPEATINLGYWVTPNAKVFAGYNVLYWSSVLRPGDQIDRVVNVSFVPNPPLGAPPSNVQRPLPTLRQTDLWANGLQFGLEFRW